MSTLLNSGLILGFSILTGILTALTWVIIDWGAWTLIVPGRRPSKPNPSELVPDPDPEPDVGWHRIEINTPDGVNLVGNWRLEPSSEGQTLILLHGFAEDRSALRGRAAALAEAHWNVVVLDSRGRGESGGAFCTFGAREIGDINLWLNQLRQLIGPKARFYIWGRSMGAAIALGAALADRSILGVILEAPYDTLQHSISTALRKRRIPGFLASWMISRASTLAGVRLDDPSPVERAAQLRTPALILAGENDSIAPLHQVHRLIKQLPNTPRLIVVPGASHQDVFEKGGPELASEIRTFLNEVRQAKSSRD